MEKSICYVNLDGSYGRATSLPEGAQEVGEEVLLLLEENPDLIEIRVEGGLIHVTPSLISYKAEACGHVRRGITEVIPGEDRLNRLMRSSVLGIGCFDVESGLYLDKDETQGNFQTLVQLSNDLRYLEAKYISKINQAPDATTVDHHLDVFQRTLQGTV